MKTKRLKKLLAYMLRCDLRTGEYSGNCPLARIKKIRGRKRSKRKLDALFARRTSLTDTTVGITVPGWKIE